MPQSITIPLTNNQFATIDAADAALVIQYRWTARKAGKKQWDKWYAVSKDADGKPIRMHQLIMGDNGDTERDRIDHINGDGLDNRRENLRFCSQAENNYNRGLYRTSQSGFKGVTWEKGVGRWRATIGVDNRRMFIGYFATKEEAARAYDAAARLVHGRFAALNFPECGEVPARTRNARRLL